MEIVIQGILLVLGFVMLIKGADWFVEGASGIADRFGIPQLVIGLTIVASGTSAPEAAVSISAAMKGNADIMAFVNEKLTPEQQQEVNLWEISYPRCAMGQILKTDILVNPWYWTVDKERKIYLFRFGAGEDRVIDF